MKPVILTAALLSFFSFFSCAAVQEEQQAQVSGLKKASLDIEEKIDWTVPVMTVELEEVKSLPGLSSSVKPNLQNLPLLKYSQPVYPFIEGFAGTDVSGAPEQAVKLMEAFCSSLVKGDVPDSCFAPSRLFVKTVFLYNLSESIKKEKIRDYLLGEPFVCEEYVQFPVRLYFDSKDRNYESRPHIDFFAYAEKTEKSKTEYLITGLNFKKGE